jgi:hypothetical protein
VGSSTVYRTNGANRAIYDEYSVIELDNPLIQFKDLGVIKASDHSLYSSSVYTGVTSLRINNRADTNTFVGKVDALLQAKDSVTGLRERMLASINEEEAENYGIDSPVPSGSQFGFLVVRNLDVLGTSEDRQIFIGIILEQEQ